MSYISHMKVRDLPFPGLLRTYQIWGTRSDIGKSVAASILLRSVYQKRRVRGAIAREGMSFLKPVTLSHKPYSDSEQVVKSFYRLVSTNLMNTLWMGTTQYRGDEKALAQLTDKKVLEGIRKQTTKTLEQVRQIPVHGQKDSPNRPVASGWMFTETFGSVSTKMPWGQDQLRLYRELDDPAVLVGSADPESGGLQEALAAYKKLRALDYDVQGVLYFGRKDMVEENEGFQQHFDGLDVPCASLTQIPDCKVAPDADPKEQHKSRNVFEHWLDTVARSNNVKHFLVALDKKFEQTRLPAMLEQEMALAAEKRAALEKEQRQKLERKAREIQASFEF